MHTIEKKSHGPGGYFQTTSGRKGDFLELPSGDFIKPRRVEAIRVQKEKADRVSGEVKARIVISYDGSWYSVDFPHEDDAVTYASQLAQLAEEVSQ